MKMRSVAIVGLVMMCLVGPTLAGDPDGTRTLRFGALFATATDDLSTGGTTTELDDAFGVHAGVEFRVWKWLGVEPTLTYGTHDVELTGIGGTETFGEVDLLTFGVNGNAHVLQNDTVDLYAGITLGNAIWGDIERDVFQDVGTDAEFFYGVNVGVDVPLGSNGWGFAAALNYLFAGVPIDGGSDDIGVDPLQIKVGAAYRF